MFGSTSRVVSVIGLDGLDGLDGLVVEFVERGPACASPGVT